MSRQWVLWVAVLITMACSDKAAEPMPTPMFDPSLQLIEGQAATDSTDAELTQALVAQVTSPTGPRAGVVVRFGIPLHAASPHATVAKPNSFQYADIVVAETDDRGRASALVRLGRVVGEAKLVVTVPEFGLADTAKYTIVAGSAISVSFTVEDTSSSVGVTRQLSAIAMSQYGNTYAGQIEFKAVSQACIVADNIVTTIAVGTCRVEAIAGAARDTVNIWVLPAVDFLAGATVLPGDSIVLFNLLRGRIRTLGYQEASDYPTAKPNGVVVYQAGNSIGVIEPDGTTTYPLLPGTSWLFQTFARLSASGDTVFFYGSQGAPTVYRILRDGTGLTPLFQQEGIEGMDVSNDGKELVFVRRGELFTIGSNGAALRPLGQTGYNPRWSPTGEWITFNRGGFTHVVRSDGTGLKQLRYELSHVDWTPDGEWLFSGSSRKALIKPDASDSMFVDTPGQFLSVVR